MEEQDDFVAEPIPTSKDLFLYRNGSIFDLYMGALPALHLPDSTALQGLPKAGPWLVAPLADGSMIASALFWYNREADSNQPELPWYNTYDTRRS